MELFVIKIMCVCVCVCVSSLEIPSYRRIIFLNIFHSHTSNSQLHCSMHLAIFYISSIIYYNHGNHP